MNSTSGQLNPGFRLLMGPGPVETSPRVLRAMSSNMLGHLDPQFIEIMNETMSLLKYVFQTQNELTLPMSGTGSAGMETVMVNLIEPQDKVIVCVKGVFGQRLRDIAGRCGAEVISVEAEWGTPIQAEQVEEALKKAGGAKLVAVVHAETSTGVLQPLEDIAKIAREYGALLVVDAVTSLGGVELKVDEWGIDACYSGTQKALSCPPGLSPLTMNKKARAAIANRKNKVQSWYLDLTMIQNYWGQERFYHHTAPINMIYGLREALQIIREEGLEARFARHKLNSQAFIQGIEAMGLAMLVKEPFRLPTLNTVRIPDGIDDITVRKYLLHQYGIEIGGGLGSFQGKVWRVGLMGESSQRRNILLFLVALCDALSQQGYKPDMTSAVEAALAVFNSTK